MNRNAAQIMNALSGYSWWKRNSRSRYTRLFFWILMICILITAVFLMIGFDNASRAEIVVCIGMVLFLAMYDLYLLVLILRSFRWQADACWFGVITDMSIIRLPNRHVKEYRISANVDGKIMDGICLSKTYYRAQKGQRVVLFTQGNDTVYCVHPDM